MKIIKYSELNNKRKAQLLERPLLESSKIYAIVQPMLNEIKKNGLPGVLKYAKKFDGLGSKNFKVSKKEIAESKKLVSKEFKASVKIAVENIRKFHKYQLPQKYSVQTMKGIKCSREFRAIENIGIYIPGGTAVLPSTLMMLAVPAIIAGCKRIVVCSPSASKIRPELLYVADYLGITEFYKIGGAQAIGLMAYGTKSINKVDKIFGPGNQYVNAAKALVSIDPAGCAIDMISGPSEVLVIADSSANPEFVSSDLLSQAEHGNDSQATLCTTSVKLAKKVVEVIERQVEKLERKKYIKNSLKYSNVIIFKNISQAIKFSNDYAPEHLILQVRNPKSYVKKIQNAGSVFLGGYSPESVGDYAAGTNHSLPTNGYAKSVGGVSVEQFMKGITFQELTKNGLKKISDVVIELATAEKLQAHANAVKIRLS